MDWDKVKAVLEELFSYFKKVFVFFYPESEETFDKIEDEAAAE